MKLLSKFKPFFDHGLWRDTTASKRLGLRGLARIVVLTVKGFIEDKATIRASALTYFTLLSIVPVFALAFAIAKGFDMEKILTDILHNISGIDKTVADYLITLSKIRLNSAKSGVIAGVGAIVLIYSVFNLLSNIESAFNRMWCVQEARPLARKVSDYVSIMVIAPILLIAAFSSTTPILSFLEKYFIGDLSPITKIIARLAPYILMWIVFTLLYLIMPNTKVKLSAAIIPGILTGTVFQLAQDVLITFQSGVSKTNGIYGGLAMLPLLLMWLQLVWTIILAGCKVAFSIQNVSKYNLEHGSENASFNLQKKVAVLIMARISKDFAAQKPPTDGLALANEIEISQPFFYKTTEILKAVNLITEVATDKASLRAFVPAIDINVITLNEVCSRLDGAGDDAQIHIKHSNLLAQIVKEYEQTMHDGTQTAGNTPLYKIDETLANPVQKDSNHTN